MSFRTIVTIVRRFAAEATTVTLSIAAADAAWINALNALQEAYVHVRGAMICTVVNVALSASAVNKTFVMVAQQNVHAMNVPKAFVATVTAYLADVARRESVAIALTMTPPENRMERFVAPVTTSFVAIVWLATIMKSQLSGLAVHASR